MALLGFAYKTLTTVSSIARLWGGKQMFMEKIGDVLGSTPPIVTTGKNLNNPIVTIETTVEGKAKNQKGHECDLALEEFSQLICSEYREWYCKVFYKIGGARFRILAAQARADGYNGGAKLFSHLLKKELSAQ